MPERKLVLIVDDDWDFAHTTTRLIEAHHEVIVCHSYQGALDAIEEQPFAAVIADFDLGVRNTGLDLLALVAARAPDTRRILYTRLVQLNPTVPHQVVTKPATAKELLDAIAGVSA
ncbi:MAG TPA: response regulator [Polyangia bacterium]